jgi:hypothetical protein
MAIAKKENVLCVSGRRRAPSVKKQRCFLRAVTKIDPGWHAPVCRLQLTRNGKFVWVVCFAVISEIHQKYQYRPMVLPRRQQNNQASRQK